MPTTAPATDGDLALFACPHSDCDAFNRFDTGNLSVCERTGKDKHIRRLYCNHCQRRFSERRGSLMAYTKLPKATVVRIVKCLGHGCSVEATADICEVAARTVGRILERAGRRAEDFHALQRDRLASGAGGVEAVELDELHGRVCKPPQKKRALGRRHLVRSRLGGGVLDAVAAAVAAWAGGGFTRRWR